jgi:hypothetical protein
MRPYVKTIARKGFDMAVHSIRSTISRFVVITGLAASLLVGSYALVQPTDASAAPWTCEDAVRWYNLYRSHAYLYWTLYQGTGNIEYAYTSGYYQGLADMQWNLAC